MIEISKIEKIIEGHVGIEDDHDERSIVGIHEAAVAISVALAAEDAVVAVEHELSALRDKKLTVMNRMVLDLATILEELFIVLPATAEVRRARMILVKVREHFTA